MKFLEEGTLAFPLKSSRYLPLWRLGAAVVRWIVFFLVFVYRVFERFVLFGLVVLLLSLVQLVLLFGLLIVWASIL